MKHIICIVTFAAWAAAQSPQSEFARVVALDEQQHDLGAAAAGYRKLLDAVPAGAPVGASVGAPRAEVAFRLGRLLLRLGRGGEAHPLLAEAAAGGPELAAGVARLQREFGQDGEREKELRARAREIIQRVFVRTKLPVAGSAAGLAQWELEPYSSDDAANLQWIGAPAVTELIAQFDVEDHEPGRAGTPALIWKIGGSAAEAWADRVAASPNVAVRVHAARGAFAATKTMAERARRWLADADPQGRVVAALLWTSPKPVGAQGHHVLPILLPFSLSDLVGVARSGPPQARTAAFERLAHDWQRSAREEHTAVVTAGLVDVVRDGLRAQHPSVGRAAMSLLLRHLLDHAGARALLIENLELIEHPVSIPQFQVQSPEEHAGAMAKAAEEIGPAPASRARFSPAQQMWFQLLHRYLESWGPAAFPAVRTALAAGYEGPDGGTSVTQWLAQHATAEQLVELVPLLPESGSPELLLQAMGRRPGPATALPELVRVAGSLRKPIGSEGSMLAFAVASIGRAEAAAAIVDLHDRSLVASGSAIHHVIGLLAEHDTPAVRAALRRLVASGRHIHIQFVGACALLERGDVAALELLPKVLALQPRKDARFADTSIGRRLFASDSGIPGSMREQIAEALVRQSPQDVVAALPDSFGGVTPPVARALFPLVTSSIDDHGGRLRKPLIELAHALASQQPIAEADRAMLAGVLADGKTPVALAVMAAIARTKTAKAFERELTLALDDETLTRSAAECLISGGAAADVAWLTRLLGSPFQHTRETAIRMLAPKLGSEAVPAVAAAVGDASAAVRLVACTALGTALDPAGVPALLGAMKDADESVRKAAADALTAIRFHHDTRSHFDRVLSGLDPSAPSVTAKLLMQAKPGQSTEQRLLAIRSLASLGAPEALPFLIDWMADPDPQITEAVRATIAQIHAKTGVK